MQGTDPDTMESEDGPLKLIFIPYLAAGHMIPLCDIAIMFASRGHHATIITTPSNAHILRKSNPFPDHLHLHTIDFPAQQVGLPDGVENLTHATNFDNAGKIYKGTELLREAMEHFIHQHPPDCIVADFLYPWVADLAATLRIPRLSFNGFCLFSLCAIDSVIKHPEIFSDSDSYVIPDLPHQIPMRTKPDKTFLGFMEPLLGTLMKSDGLIVNSLVEVDGEEYVEYYQKKTGHSAWHVGPASVVRRSAKEKAERGHKSVVSQHECLSWLNSKQPNSVIYISFGSISHFPDNQLYEIACAIEASEHDFVWVVPEKKGKDDESEEEKEKWMPRGFEERNKEKRMILRGWAPQVLILEHAAVGAFMTHCGWNSTVECIGAGVPMITWPLHSDQFCNEKLITQILGVGVEVGAREWSLTRYGDDKHKLISRYNIEEALRRVMDGGDEAIQIKRRAQQFGNKSRQALEEGGSSHNNLTALIDHLKRLRETSKPVD